MTVFRGFSKKRLCSSKSYLFFRLKIKYKIIIGIPRDHERRPGSRQYLDFIKENLEAGIKALQEAMSRRDAEKEFCIP